MASLHDFLCYPSTTTTDSLLEELLPTRFHSHIFDYIVYEHSLDDESVHSIDSSLFGILFRQFNLLFLNTFIFFFLF